MKDESRFVGFTFDWLSFKTVQHRLPTRIMTGPINGLIDLRLEATLAARYSLFRGIQNLESLVPFRKFVLNKNVYEFNSSHCDLLSTLCCLVAHERKDVSPRIYSTDERISDSSQSGHEVSERDHCFRKFNGRYPFLERQMTRSLAQLFGGNSAVFTDDLLETAVSVEQFVGALTSVHGGHWQRLVYHHLSCLTGCGQMGESLNILVNLSSSVVCGNPQWHLLKDFVACCVVNSSPGGQMAALQISDPLVRCRSVLGNYDKSSAKVQIALLRSCTFDSEILKEAATRCLKEVLLFDKVMSN